MQQNPNDTTDRTSGSQGAGQESGAFGTTRDRPDANRGDATGDRSASAFSDTSGTPGRESLGGESKLEQTTEQAKGKLHQVRERATTLKATLADKLEAGAERLRQRAATTPAPDTATTTEVRTNVNKVGSRVASGMESTAEWLRTADMATVKSGIENQVRHKPGRTLLIALGLGYLLGRAIRGGGGKREM
jgi:hypothetical protein